MSSPPESTTITSPTPTPITALPISNSPIITTIPSSQSSNGHGLDNAEESPVASSSSSGLSNSTNLQGTPAFTSRTLQKTGTASYTIRKLNRPAQNPAPSSAPPPPPSVLAPAPPTISTASTSTSSSTSSSIPPVTPAFPALHLTPLNDTFVPKQIALSPIGSKIKIGRQTNAKTVPNGANGYFDSKVLSRMHAEVWSEQGKIWIKDVKSSNGTFINGDRLSAEAAESDPFELHTDDVVEFGIDIVSDDNKTIVHHKVAAKIHLVLNADDALASSREFNTWYRIAGEAPVHRRPIKPAQSNTTSNGLSFEHVLNRLQGELQKSRDTGSNLSDVSSTLNEVQDTLGGGAPPSLPPFPHPSRIPPYVPNLQKEAHTQSIAALQSQLNETQNSLAGHVGKMRDLEGLLAEHDGIKREVGGLRKLIEEAMESMERGNGRESNGGRDIGSRGRNGGRESPIAALLEAQEQEDDEEDDTRSISSVETIRLNTADQLAAAQAAQAKFRFSNGINEFPSSPPSSSSAKELQQQQSEESKAERLLLQEQNSKLLSRLETLSIELEAATSLGHSLRSQHTEASETIKSLEIKVINLEKAVEIGINSIVIKAETKWNGWKEAFEASYREERLNWDTEREHLNKVVKEWEEKKAMDLVNQSNRRSNRSSRYSDDDEDGDSSAEEADSIEEDGQLDATSNVTRSSRASTSDLTASTSNSKSSSTAKSNSKSRRKRRASNSNGTRVGKLSAVDSTSTTLSDSDSTIGENGKVGLVDPNNASTQAWTETTKSLSGSSNGGNSRSGFDIGKENRERVSQALPYVSAGAVVIIGFAAAWALSLKAKE